jgi:hypothetical protein
MVLKTESGAPPRGLPDHLPRGETILWQGSPQWRPLARDALHLRALAAYFGGLLALRGLVAWSDSHQWQQAALAMLWLLPLALAALGVLALIAWLSGRTSVYTITNRRIVLTIGIALPVSFNIPFGSIAAVDQRIHPDGSGDLPLTLSAGNKIAYLHLWPHARPWQLRRSQPMLRSIPEAAQVGALLARARAEAGAATAPAPMATPDRGARPTQPGLLQVTP